MSRENKKPEKMLIDAHILEEVQHTDAKLKEHKREAKMAERRIKMAKLKVHDLIETAHPELADKCYSIDPKEGTISLDCDCDGESPVKSMLDKLFGGKN